MSESSILSPDIRILDYTMISAMGSGLAATREALLSGQSGLQPNDFPRSGLPTWIGRVKAIDDFIWSADRLPWQSRNNALAALGLQQDNFWQSLSELKERFTTARIGIVIGSSTSSIDRTEEAYHHLTATNELAPEFRQRNVLNIAAPALFIAELTGLQGPQLTISTACSSSAKVFATAARWLNTGIVDAVLVGGVDTLCLSVIHGFHALQLVSTEPCRPFDQARDGINLGEAAGFALLAKADSGLPETGIRLSGYGESSDAHHMSHPHPQGLGAELALTAALRRGGLTVTDIDYINLHGTASIANDLIEGQLIGRLFADTDVIASSTKAWTGHTLGAAGILEAIIAMETIRQGFIPASLNFTEGDPEISRLLATTTIQKKIKHVLSNSFGFGGNNACLLFSAIEATT